MYLAGVELNGETTGVADGLGAAALVDDGGEADNDGRLDAGGPEEVGAGEAGDVVRALEEPLRARPPSMHHPLRYPLPREVRDLLDQMIVLQQDRP